MRIPSTEKEGDFAGGRCRFHSQAFTLVEMLLSMTVLAILLLVITGVINQTQKAWSYTSARTTQFREARFAFDLLTRYLSQATLNTYWNYDKDIVSILDSNQLPTKYVRQSELQFISGQSSKLITAPGSGAPDATKLPYHSVFFQAPLGITEETSHDSFQNLLAGRGYFVQFGSDDGFKPPFVTQSRYRYRLMEYSPTTEKNMIYWNRSQVPPRPVNEWFKAAGAVIAKSDELGGATADAIRGGTRPVAENIIGLIIAPKVAREVVNGKDPYWIAADYNYDSTDGTKNVTLNTPQGTQHLLPPLVDVIMIAIDEASAMKLASKHNNLPVNWSQGGPFITASIGNIEADLKGLEKFLVDEKLNYRVFSATIEIKGSRWSL
jgi:uncharacterized protein (TIGR02599 family)